MAVLDINNRGRHDDIVLHSVHNFPGVNNASLLEGDAMTKPITGTKEWAEHNANIYNGCVNGCRYCYARYNAVHRFKKIPEHLWLTPCRKSYSLENEMEKWKKKSPGRIMFPTQHDIWYSNMTCCRDYIHMLVEKCDREVLVVTKPRLEVVKFLCHWLEGYKNKITFRFTIGAISLNIVNYWEPYAPTFGERLASLEHAFERGFQTSVSMEPLLEEFRLQEMISAFYSYVTDSIWIGMMNNIKQRVKIETEEDRAMVKLVENGQRLEKVREIYDTYNCMGKIRWKDSYKRVLGLPLQTESGEKKQEAK
jgi:DNA repair photolyase